MNQPPQQTIPYQDLTPDTVLSAVETTGALTSGSLLALNSYENRVYQVGLDDGDMLVVKFYRPQRWSDAAIHEEHAFALELAAQDIPVVPPLADSNDETLHHYLGFRFAVFARRGGRAPELDDADNLRWLGRVLGRLHAVGASDRFEHRPVLSVERFGDEPFRLLRDGGFVATEVRHNYCDAAERVLDRVRDIVDAVGPLRSLRLHGDCHPGNILWTDQGPHFVDLDDCLSGPAVQDLWMLLSGSRDDMQRQLRWLLEGYNQFFEFDPFELQLVEALRALRMIHYSGWLARRWHDPAFPLHFPWFGTPRYWEDQMITLREQQQRLDEPPLKLG
jgi:Ser/Thr protein kinase RdoA (MazF antagonist)